MHIKCKIVVAVLIVAATLIIGCAGGTELSVTAPEEVDVQSAITRLLQFKKEKAPYMQQRRGYFAVVWQKFCYAKT